MVPTEVVCIYGSRDMPLKYRQLVHDAIDKLKPGTVVVSGMARGVDRWAADYAKKIGLEVWPYYAQWKVDGVLNLAAGFERNTEMVEISDRGLGFSYRHSGGTQDTTTKFEMAGKQTVVVEVG